MTPDEEIALLRAQLAAKDAALSAKDAALAESRQHAKKLANKVQQLETQLRLLKKQLFGKKSEKVDPRQLTLAFDEACAEAAAADPPLSDEPYPAELLAELEQAEGDEDVDESQPKQRRRRTKFPPDLDVVRDEEIHPPPDELRCDCGCEKVRMGEDVSRRLEVVPARFFWREQVRVKYSCPACASIPRPPLPPAPIEKSLAGTSLLVDILLHKYLDHLPLDRLTRIYARDGVELSKQTLWSWVSASTGLLEPVAEQVFRDVLARSVVQMDETGILVLDRDHPEGRSKGRMWVFCGETGELFYEYTPSKESKWAKQLLAPYRGTLQADAYGGFDVLYVSGEILEAGCNAHARRKFNDAHDAEPTRPEPQWALLAYQRLFAVEREAKERGLSPDERLALRQQKSASVVRELYTWLEQLRPLLLPSDPLRTAVGYALNHRKALTRFLSDGRVELDNNRSERSLRQVAVGRKNWLFAGSPAGARAAAVAYTLIMSCRELAIPPREYLTDVLERVSTHPADRVAELTPRAWKAARDLASADVAS